MRRAAGTCPSLEKTRTHHTKTAIGIKNGWPVISQRFPVAVRPGPNSVGIAPPDLSLRLAERPRRRDAVAPIKKMLPAPTRFDRDHLPMRLLGHPLGDLLHDVGDACDGPVKPLIFVSTEPASGHRSP